MKKTFAGKGLAWILLSSMVFSMLYPCVPENKCVQAEATEGCYIITAKNERALEAVYSRYEGILDVCPGENPQILAEEGVFVSELTAAEAAKLAGDSQVLSVERDVMLEGSGDKKSIGKGRKTGGNFKTHRAGGSGGCKKVWKKNGVTFVDAGKDPNWNLEMVHGADAGDRGSAMWEDEGDAVTAVPKEKVKVAILDSGVDMLDTIEVKERVNLIPGQEDFTVMFEDEAGHGTAVAGIIAGETMAGETAEGINKNVELYSAKVLDENNQAPLSRVIEGIYWAIGQDVHIINMSFGCSKYSPALEDAVKAAAEKGILIVAAAGNHGESGRDTVEYPAAFPEVVAVGAVDARGEVSDFSARGEEVELAAPGEALRVTGAFGADMLVSGTSMAAPHVTAVASLLWEKDLTKSAGFIRTLLDTSARELGSGEEAGYGLVDYAYAQKIYDRVESQMKSGKEVSVPENVTEIQVFDNREDVERLEDVDTAEDKESGNVAGSWRWGTHTKYLDDNKINLPAMKQGAVYPDKEEAGTDGMKIHPEFHGYFRDGNKQCVNYVACYHFMIKIAEAYGKGKDYTVAPKVKGLTDASYKVIRQGFKGMDKKIKSFAKKADRRAFVYGIAMHTATDVFAHSTLKYIPNTWIRIKHKPINEADDPAIEPRRFTMAYRVQRNNIYRFQGKRDDVPICHDFHAAGDTDGTYYYQGGKGPYYRAVRLEIYADLAGVTNKTVLNHFHIISRDFDGK